MDELIQQLTSRVGIDAATAQQGVARVMSLLKKEGGDDLFSKIAAAIPGANAAADTTPDPIKAGGGAGLLGAVMGMFGGSAGKGMALAAALKAIGIGDDKLPDFVSTVVSFIKDKVGPETVQQVLVKFPMLKPFLG
jgi:hypothetical protein